MVLARGLRLAVFRSAFSQGDAGGSDTPSGHDRSSATTGIGGMPGVPQSVATRSQHVLAPTARSAVAGSAGDHPRRRAAVPLFESELHPSDVRRAPHGSCLPFWPSDRAAERSPAHPRSCARRRSWSALGCAYLGSGAKDAATPPSFGVKFWLSAFAVGPPSCGTGPPVIVVEVSAVTDLAHKPCLRSGRSRPATGWRAC